MTVAEIVAALSEMPPHAKVLLEAPVDDRHEWVRSVELTTVSNGDPVVVVSLVGA